MKKSIIFLVLGLSLISPIIGSTFLVDLEWVEVSRQVYLMGTLCTLTTYSPHRQSGLQQLEVFLDILEKTEQELSTWRPDSTLSRLNRQPLQVPFVVDKSLCRLFTELVLWQQATGSTFDPAIGPLLEAWGVHKGGQWPRPEVLEAARERSGMGYFRFDPSLCQITREREVTLDAGAFGKGEALDRVLRYTLAHGSTPWLIDLGGQITVYGQPPGATSWKVDLAHPQQRNQPLLTLDMISGSLSTSAGSERDSYVNGRRIGHILDPRTGRPADFTGSVTVWHEQALVADILSTALYVMGPKEGLPWAEARNLAVCFFTIQNGKVEIQASQAFKQRFQLSKTDLHFIK
jgi:thiamine biosynthesis lipoprotein